MPATRTPATRDDLFARLAELGIASTTVDHEAVFTVAESEKLYASIPGGHTKNLFLKDAKDKLYLVVAESHTRVDLKALPKAIGSARLSFGKPDLLMDALGITPGSVSVFCLMNDRDRRVGVIIDEALMKYDVIVGHPMTNTASTSIARDDLFRFIESCGHEPRVVRLDCTNGAS